jgi:hypothetical protein
LGGIFFYTALNFILESIFFLLLLVSHTFDFFTEFELSSYGECFSEIAAYLFTAFASFPDLQLQSMSFTASTKTQQRLQKGYDEHFRLQNLMKKKRKGINTHPKPMTDLISVPSF